MSPPKVTTIYLDHDVNFEKYFASELFGEFKKALWQARESGNFWFRHIYRRMSPRGHVHVKITLSRGISIYQSLQARSALQDDPGRLACDLSRLWREGEDCAEVQNRMFDRKFVKDRIVSAGEWELIDDKF